VGFFKVSRSYAKLGPFPALKHLTPLKLRHRAKFHIDVSIGSKVMSQKLCHQKQCHKPFYERAKNIQTRISEAIIFYYINYII
jgi:hypothetical protein